MADKNAARASVIESPDMTLLSHTSPIILKDDDDISSRRNRRFSVEHAAAVVGSRGLTGTNELSQPVPADEVGELLEWFTVWPEHIAAAEESDRDTAGAISGTKNRCLV
jgi:hypothetical protein